MPAKAKLVTREATSSTVTSDNLNKGSALEFAELDSNMINLRDQTFGVVGDDSATIDIAAGGTLYIQGGTNVTTATNSDGSITINSTGGSASTGDISFSGSVITSSGALIDFQDNINVSTPGAEGGDIGNMMRVTADSVDINQQGTIGNYFTVYGARAQESGYDAPFAVGLATNNDVKINGYKMPVDDGIAKQIMYTNGSNTVAWGYEIKDEDNMSTNSSNCLATQQSIKAYVDANVGGGWRVFGDDSAGVDIATGGSLYIRGGDNITTATNSDGTITITASDSLSLIDEDNMATDSATRPPSQQSVKAYADTKAVLTGSTNNTLTTVTGAHAFQGEANATFDGSTLAITGNITATTSIANDAISLDDNVIKTTRSNDDLRIAGSGTGLINISPTNDTVGDAYSTNSRYKHGTNIVYHNETCDASAMTGSGDREYVNNTIGKWKLTGGTSDSDARFRGAVNVGAIDLNQQTVSSSSKYAGIMASYHEAYATNTHATKGTLGQMTAIFAGNWVNGNEDMDITTSTCVLAEGWIEQYNDSDIELTTAYGYRYEGQGPGIYGSGGSVTITTEYGFHCGSLFGNTKWAFYDATNGQSLFGDVKINQNTISTNSSNANLEISANGSGTINLENLQVGTGATVTTILDEDAMGTNSATALATQQSIKAYADSVVNLIDEDDMSTDSATRPPSQQSVKAYVDGQNHTSLSGSTNNTIATVTGANALAGEANLTFDGSTLAVTGNITATTSIANDHITIDGNEITTSSTNADLELSANGTGRVIIAANGADFATTSTAARYNNSNTLLYQDLTHTIANERVYGNNIIMDIKLDAGQDTNNGNDRWRNWHHTIFDLNGSSCTATSGYLTYGPSAGSFELDIKNTSTAGESHIGNASGVHSGIWCSSSANSSILFEADDSSSTNVGMAAYTSWIELDTASGSTISIPNVYSYFSKGTDAYGGGTKAITNAYAFYASPNNGTASITNEYAFYDANDSGTSKFGDIQISGNNITTLSSNADLELQTAGTGNIVLNDISISDNKIHANRSNDTLLLEAAGTGRVNIGNGDFADDPGSLWSNAFGSTSNVKGTVICHEDLTHDPGSSRVYNSVIQTSIKTDGSDTTSGDGRLRGLLVNTALDLNGSSMTHSSIYRGTQAVNAQSFITNTSADDAVLSTATGFTGYVYAVPGGSSGDLTITNAIACGAATDFDASSMPSDKTLTVTNSHNFYADTSWMYGGSATKVCTNHYAFYSKAQSIATNNWIFYDATSAGTSSQNRLGAIQLINQASAPTPLANHSWIYALDDSASSEVYVKDEAGNATKISPHNKEGEWEYYSKNTKTGKTFRVNMERMIKKIEELTGETFIETN